MEEDETVLNLEKNLRIVSLHRALLHSYGFPIATIVLFFQEHGLQLSEVLLLQAIFAVAFAVLEVPSGYVADCLGRRRTLVAGSLALLLSAAAYLGASGFLGFLLAELLCGLGLSLISGADQALFYDSLVELKREQEFARRWSRVCCIELIGSASAMLIGGFVGAVNYRLPFVLTLVGFALLCWNALRFYEPKRKVLEVEHGHLRELGRIAFECLWKRKELGWLIVLAAVLHMFNQAGFWLYQPLLKLREVPEAYFGLIYAGMSLAAAYLAGRIYKLEDRLGFVRSVLLAALVGASGYWLLALLSSRWALSFVLAFQFVRVVNRVLFDHQLNKLIDSEVRATVVSIKNMVQGLSYSALLVALGPVVDSEGVAAVYALLGALMLGGALIVVAFRPRAIKLWRAV